MKVKRLYLFSPSLVFSIFSLLFIFEILLILNFSVFQLVFIIFQLNLIFSTWLVIFNTNPIYSVLFLVLVFFNGASLLFFLNIDFLAFMLIIVYIGAIAVLFLFVVMMLNIRVLKFVFSSYAYFIAGFFGLFFLTFLLYYLTLLNSDQGSFFLLFGLFNWFDSIFLFSNAKLIAKSIYEIYIFEFVLSLICLLIAMLGAISLTFTPSLIARKQSVYAQVIKDFHLSLE